MCACVCVCVCVIQRERGGRRETEKERELFLMYCVLANTKKPEEQQCMCSVTDPHGFPKSCQYTAVSHAIQTTYYIKIFICQIAKSEVGCYRVKTGLQQNTDIEKLH